METNGISRDMYSNMSGGSTMLGLEMSSNHRHQQNPNMFHRHQQPPLAADHRHPPPAAKQAHPFAHNPRTSPHSDDDDPHSNNNNNPTTTEDSGGDGKMRKGSPWQRMKWTDNMVRLLIMVVFYIGDEAGSDPSGTDPSAKKKAGGGGGGAGAGGGGVLQKKGKWKSVSNAMMERGFCVSPQQCEDKFNDLNKRYKRVNDILGKGIACKVVENQSLLESMDHLSAKTKEEVKKLLNSKHLFFREMCAYHNSCATSGAGGGSGGHHSPPLEAVQSAQTGQPQSHTHQCVHSSDKNAMISCYNDEEEDEEEECGTHEGRSHYNHREEDEDEDEDDGLWRRKRGRMNENGLVRQFSGEVMNVVQDLTKSVREKRQWMKGRMMQLEEQRLGFQGEAYELEKQRLKWVKFSYKKERDMEVEKLRNERMRLENDRMVILLRQKELELIEQQQCSSTTN